jgi:hypothetical protein
MPECAAGDGVQGVEHFMHAPSIEEVLRGYSAYHAAIVAGRLPPRWCVVDTIAGGSRPCCADCLLTAHSPAAYRSLAPLLPLIHAYWLCLYTLPLPLADCTCCPPCVLPSACTHTHSLSAPHQLGPIRPAVGHRLPSGSHEPACALAARSQAAGRTTSESSSRT